MTLPDREKRSGLNDEVLAGEYVLGALSEAANTELAKRIKTDRQFAATVRRWQDNLSQTQQNDQRAYSAYGAIAGRDSARRTQRRHNGLSGILRLFAGLWASVSFWRLLAVASLVWVSFLLA
ncbi:hypothetical protein [Agrobacterium sp. CG674]